MLKVALIKYGCKYCSKIGHNPFFSLNFFQKFPCQTFQTKKQEEKGSEGTKEVKKPPFGKESRDDPSKVGKLDLKATFGKLAAKHAPVKTDDEMKNEAQDTKTISDEKNDVKGEDKKEVKKSVTIKLPEEEDTASKGKYFEYLAII